jgi:hypothetical protein
VRPPQLIHSLGVVQLNVQVLVHALERAANLDFVFEFDGDFMLDERFEEAKWVLARGGGVLGRGAPEEEHYAVGVGGVSCWGCGKCVGVAGATFVVTGLSSGRVGFVRACLARLICSCYNAVYHST